MPPQPWRSRTFPAPCHPGSPETPSRIHRGSIQSSPRSRCTSHRPQCICHPHQLYLCTRNYSRSSRGRVRNHWNMIQILRRNRTSSTYSTERRRGSIPSSPRRRRFDRMRCTSCRRSRLCKRGNYRRVSREGSLLPHSETRPDNENRNFHMHHRART